MEAAPATQQLELVSAIGFEGKHLTRNDVHSLPCLYLSSPSFLTGSIPGGLIAHPDGCHIVYPLGCTVIIQVKGSDVCMCVCVCDGVPSSGAGEQETAFS